MDNKICDDLAAVLAPRSITVVADWNDRGGITAEYAPKPARRR